MENSRSSIRKELPEECWELIMTRLVVDDDYRGLKSSSLVCKQFLSITDRLRRKLVAKNSVFYGNRCEVFCRALKRFRNLRDMELYDCQEDMINYPIWKIALSGLDLRALKLFSFPKSPSPNSLRKLGLTMKNLKILKCRDIHSFGDQDLVAIADALPRLEELDIMCKEFDAFIVLYPRDSSNIVTDADIEVISRKLLGLRKIDISGHYACSDRSLIALSSNCVHLQEIRCSTCKITAHGGLCFVLRHSPNLIYLQAEGTVSSPESSFTFHNSKNFGTAMLYLDLCKNQDQVLCSIAEAGIPLEKLILRHDFGLSFYGLSTFLCACPALKHLTLGFVDSLSDHSMRDLCKSLPNVRSIVLWFCPNVTIATLFILAKECPALSAITLNTTNNLNEVRNDFVIDLERNHRITSLDLNINWGLNDELLKKVGLVCPNLHTLDVRGCGRLTKQGIWEILKCCSQLKHVKVSKRMEIHLKKFETSQTRIEYW